MLFVSAEAKNQDLVLLASPLIVLVAFFVLADSLRLVVTYALNSLSDMKVPSLILGLAYWGISLPVGVVLGFTMELGILGLWWGLVFGIAVAAITHLIRFRWLVRHSLVTAVKSV
nr:MAG: multidrug resistance protein, MATE family [Candidatus Kentron sp. FW]